MVLLHVKKSDELQFLFETTTSASVDETVADVVEIWNRIVKIRRACDGVEDLASHGPAKPGDKQGLDEYDESPPARGPHYRPDPTGRRTGEAPAPQDAEMLRRHISEVMQVTQCKEMVGLKEIMTVSRVREAWEYLRGAVTKVYPGGLPDFDEVSYMLQHDDFEQDSRTQDIIPEEEAVMWWAGKQFMKGQKLSDYVGKNEKTKIIAKLQRSSSGAPAREPVVDAQTQKDMMAFYFKKQEEAKQLEEDAEDAYLDSAWANPASLKAQLQGTTGVSWRAGGRVM